MLVAKDRRRHRRRISRDISDDIVLLSRPISNEPMLDETACNLPETVWMKSHMYIAVLVVR